MSRWSPQIMRQDAVISTKSPRWDSRHLKHFKIKFKHINPMRVYFETKQMRSPVPLPTTRSPINILTLKVVSGISASPTHPLAHLPTPPENSNSFE